MFTKAPLARPMSRAGACGQRALAARNHRRQCGGRIEQHHEPHRRYGGRRRLSALAKHARRLCARRRRHQFRRQQSRQRPVGSVPGRRLCATHQRRGLYHRPRCLWLAGHHHQPQRHVAGLDQLRAEFNANAYSGRVEGGYRFVAPWVGGIGITPYAAAQFTTFDLPAYAESVLSGAALSRWPMPPRASPTRAANSASAPTNPSPCPTAC